MTWLRKIDARQNARGGLPRARGGRLLRGGREVPVRPGQAARRAQGVPAQHVETHAPAHAKDLRLEHFHQGQRAQALL